MKPCQPEIWLPIPDYEGLYEVSNQGRVRACPKTDARGNQRKSKILSPFSQVRGYQRIELWHEGKPKKFGVHQLVAMAFLGHQPSGMKWVVDHKDNNPQNNHVSNLVVATQGENVRRYYQSS